MTPDEAENLENGGRYADYLRGSLTEIARASIEGRPGDEALWTAHAARACRRVGKAVDALAHAARAADLARGVADPLLPALVRHAQAVALRCARRYDESLAGLKEALDLLPPDRDALRADVLLETAETALEAGAGAEAGAALDRAPATREPRLLAWSLYLRCRLREDAPADPRLAAAYELATRVGCPELRWQILWSLSERTERLRDDLIWCAVGLLARLADPLAPEDATFFWRAGPRRVFVDQAQRRFGATFLHKIMTGEAALKDPSELIRQGLGFDPGAVAEILKA